MVYGVRLFRLVPIRHRSFRLAGLMSEADAVDGVPPAAVAALADDDDEDPKKYSIVQRGDLPSKNF